MTNADSSALDLIETTGGSIAEIHFRSVPKDTGFLDVLNEVYGEELKLFFPTGEYLGNVDEVSESAWSANIVSALLQSDVFEDSSALTEFPQMETLVICCKLPEGSHFDTDALSDTATVLTDNLSSLKKVTFSIDASEEAFDAAHATLKPWFDDKIECDIVPVRIDQRGPGRVGIRDRKPKKK